MDGQQGGVTARRLWTRVLWVAIGALLASGAVAAALADDDDPDPPEAVAVEHTYPAEHAGPVWIVVTAPDDDRRDVLIQWGPWNRPITHRGTAPVTYVFDKGPTEPGDQVVPTSVSVDPGAKVEFGHGAEPPPGSVDVREGWVPAEDG